MIRNFNRIITTNFQTRMMSGANGDSSSGADKGGGGAGAIREAGGAFGKREAALEDQYFYEAQKQQLQQLNEKKHSQTSKEKKNTSNEPLNVDR